MARVMSVPRFAFGLFLIMVIAGWVAPAGADGILDGVINGSNRNLVDVTAAQRTAAIIKTLSGETLTQSFEMAGFAKDYFYPGYISDFHDSPREPLHTLMSNRRFAKLYGELSALSPDEQYNYLSKYFELYLEREKAIMSRFKNGAATASEGYGILYIIPDGPKDAISQHGTTQALRAIAILSGMLGNGRMWPILKPALENPATGFALDETMYEKGALEIMQGMPVFNEAIRAETIFLISRNAGVQAREMGIDTTAVLAAVPSDGVEEVQLLDYRAEVTQYDVLHEFSDLPIDTSHGSYRVKLLMMKSMEISRKAIEKIIVAGGLKPAPESL